MRDEARRQIVQQFRMGGFFSLHSVVARRGHQRPAEVPAPHPIYHHSRSQGRGVREDLLRQLQPPGSVFQQPVALGEYGWKMSRDNLAGGRDIAMGQNREIAGLARLVDQPGELRVTAIHVLRRIVDGVHERFVRSGDAAPADRRRLWSLDARRGVRGGNWRRRWRTALRLCPEFLQALHQQWILFERRRHLGFESFDLRFPFGNARFGAHHRGCLAGQQVRGVAQIEQSILRPQVALLHFRVHVQHRPLDAHGGSEYTDQTVIVLGGDGVELVVVAARAAHGQRQQAARNSIHALVPVVGHEAADHVRGQALVLVIDGRCAEVAESSQVVARRARHQVGSELELHETVVGNVAVDCIDDPVAISPGIRIRGVGGLRRRIVLAKARHIHPVAAPAFAVLRRGLQTIDQRFPGIGRGIVGECFDLLIGRLVPHQIDVGATHQRALFFERRRLETLGLELLQDEGIDRVDGPCGVLYFGRRNALERLKGPPLPPVFQRHPFVGRRCRTCRGARRRGGHRHSARDPLLEVRDYRIRQFSRRRHLQERISVGKGLDQTVAYLRYCRPCGPAPGRSSALSARTNGRDSIWWPIRVESWFRKT